MKSFRIFAFVAFLLSLPVITIAQVNVRGSQIQLGGNGPVGMVYPPAGLGVSTGTAWRTPTFSDVVALWASGSCTSGYLAYDGSCSTPAGGSSVQVNGSTIANPNFNGSTPAAPAGATNKTFQFSGSNVSVYDYAVQYNPPNTQYYFVGSSQLVHTTDDLSPTGATTLTITAGSCNGTTCTATATNTLTTSDWVLFSDTIAMVPNCLHVSIVPVSSATGSQFTFPESETSCSGAQSGFSGTAYLGTHLLSAQACQQPFFKDHGTCHYIPEATYQETIAGLVTNYTAYIHPKAPAVTGLPTTLYIMGGFIDIGLVGSSVASVESSMQSLWALARTDGFKVIEITNYLGTPRINDGDLYGIMQLNRWVPKQGPYGGGSGYVDGVVDIAAKISNWGDSGTTNSLYADNTHLSNTGNWIAASLLNRSLGSQNQMNEEQTPTQGFNYFVGNQSYTHKSGETNGCISNWGQFGTNPNDYQVCSNLKGGFVNSLGNLAISHRWVSGSTTMQNAAPNNGVWAWMDGADAFFSNVDSGINRQSAGILGVGNGSKTDTSGSFKLTGIFGQATAPSGACASGLSGMWQFTTDGTISRCPSGGGTWTAFAGAGFSNPMTTLGDAMYGGASGVATRLAGPTTASHTFFFGWQPSGSAIAPAAVDFGANAATWVKATLPIVATQNANDVTLSCPTCGTSSATSVSVNGGSALGSANFNDTTPATAAGGTNVKWQQSGSNVSAYVPATPVPVVLDTSTPVTVSTTNAFEIHNNQNATAATAITYNLPTAAAGKQFCFTNSYNGSAATTGVLTIAGSAAGQFIIFTDGTLSATGGNVTSGGAAGDAACMVGVDATHWQIYAQRGTWTKH